MSVPIVSEAYRFVIWTSSSLSAYLHIYKYADWQSSLTYWNQKVVRRESIIDHIIFNHHFFGWSEVSGRVTNYNKQKDAILCVSSSKFFKAIKGVWWMPWLWEAMKDVVSCDKLGGTAHKYYIPRFPNGTTQYTEGVLSDASWKPTPGTETSKYREEKKINNDSPSSGERTGNSLNFWSVLQEGCRTAFRNCHQAEFFGKLNHRAW